jgi:hypothetical protein
MSFDYGYENHEGRYEGGEGYEDPGAHGSPRPPSDPDPSAGRGRRRRAAPEPEQFEPQPQPEPEPAYSDAQWEHSGLGWDRQAWDEAQRVQHAYPDEQYGHPAPGYDSPAYDDPGYNNYDNNIGYAPAEYRPDEYDASPEYGPAEYAEETYRPEASLPLHFPDAAPPADPGFTPGSNPDAVPAVTTSASASASTSTLAGQGAFGAAGLAVVTGVGALAAKPVLAVVVGLSQAGLAVGWSRTVGLPNARRTMVLVALIGLSACALAYRLVPDRAPAAMGAALGVGFVFLAGDQLFRKDTGAGRHRSEALAAAAAGATFAVLPAGYLVAQRADSALAGACALAAAVAVLCSALVGGGAHPAGIAAAVAAAAAVGTLTAVSLNASAGAKGGAFGGLVSGLFAVVAARMTDRIGSEGSDVRISSQALPVAFSAVGAVVVSQMLR